ncbi:MAG: hypothetical protein JXR64_04435 [Spirochaetales bacterium]|nr:hypothetical protein [Spirochaetales bacterium]
MYIKTAYSYFKKRKLKRKGRIYITKLSLSLSHSLKIDYKNISKLKVSDVDIEIEGSMEPTLKKNYLFYKNTCSLKSDDLLFPGH